MFVEDIKKQGVVHVHLITNIIIKEIHHLKRSELKILKEFCRVVVFVAPNRHIRRWGEEKNNTPVNSAHLRPQVLTDGSDVKRTNQNTIHCFNKKCHLSGYQEHQQKHKTQEKIKKSPSIMQDPVRQK